MWSDNETCEDLLGFSIHTQLLESVLKNPEMLPISIGLFGDWGGGKSSILKMLQHELDQDNEYAVIYFNSWVFEGYEDAKSALLTTLLKELHDHRDLKNVIGDEVKNLIKRVNWMKLLKFGVSAGISYLTANPFPLLMSEMSSSTTKPSEDKAPKSILNYVSDIKLDDFINANQETIQSIRTFRSDFEKLIEKTKLKAVIILIDDLDRCSPERLIENLEAIRLFLNVSHTAFVIATDRRIVENAIRIRFSKLFNENNKSSIGESLITDYLEKLIQVPYTLPKLAPHEVRSYMSLLFLKKHLSVDIFNNVHKNYTQFLTKERYSAFPLDEELDSIKDEATRSVVTESLRLVDACSDAITDGLKGNPRQIKRFLNGYWLRKELAHVANLIHLKDHILIKLMVLEYISDECFDELYQWHRISSDGIANPLEELENSSSIEVISDQYLKWRTPRIWRWLKAEPSLKSEDLRDYFWVARSSISDTLTGVRLMTHAMRICSEELLSTVETKRKNGVAMFASLSEDEQGGVIGIIQRHAMQETKEDASLRSLIDLAGKGYFKAADAFSQCVDRIGAEALNPGLGITLRAFKVESEIRSSELIGQVREKLIKTDTPIGRALQSKIKGKT